MILPENVDPQDMKVNLYAEFATRHELHVLDQKVDELVKAGAGMAVAVETLNKSVEEISLNIKLLVVNKGVTDRLKQLIAKSMMGTVSFILCLVVPMLVAHWVGLIKIFGKWVQS